MRLPSFRSLATPLAVVATAWSTPLLAQSGENVERIVWEVGPASAAWCVHFLMEPKEAGKELFPTLRTVPASMVSDLHPALKRAISDEPTYAEWIPSELCTYYVESVKAGDKLYQRGDKNVPLAVLFWGVAVAEGEAGFTGQMWLRELASNSYPLARAMQVSRLPVAKVNIDRDSIKGNQEDQLFYTKLEGATIQFTGHFNPDTTEAPVAARRHVGLLPGPIQTKWTSTVNYTPVRAGTMAGSLQVFGKRGLAKALNRSPIRLIGPAFEGGSGTVEYLRSALRKK